MDLIRGSLLHKFLTEGSCKVSDEYLQGNTNCELFFLVLGKTFVLAFWSFVIFCLTFGNFFMVSAEGFVQPPAFLVVTFIGTTIFDSLLVCVIAFAIILVVGEFWGSRIKKFWDGVFDKIGSLAGKLAGGNKISCGTVKVLDKRIKK